MRASFPRAHFESEISAQPAIPFGPGTIAATDQLKYAGFRIRILAFIIDLVLTSALFVSVVIVVGINIGMIILSDGYSSSDLSKWFYVRSRPPIPELIRPLIPEITRPPIPGLSRPGAPGLAGDGI